MPSNTSAVSDPPLEDKNYGPVLKSWYRHILKYKDLELFFESSAVLLSPQMKNAYEKRLYGTQGSNVKIDKNIMGDGTTIGIVVSHFAKSHALLELNDVKVWTLQLNIDGKQFSPESVLYYRNKDILSAYFPDASYWSRFYVVLFKLPPHILANLESGSLFQKNETPKDLPPMQDGTIVFTMNSGEIQMKFSWDP